MRTSATPGQGLQARPDQARDVVGDLERVCLSLVNAIHMIGQASASTLAMIGSSMSSGRRPRTRETLVAHVAAAASGSRSSLKRDGDVLASERELDDDDVHALDAGERVLEHLGDLALDHVGGGAAVDRLDVDDRLVDLRVLAHRHARVRDRADQQHGEREHGREDRPLDAYLG